MSRICCREYDDDILNERFIYFKSSKARFAPFFSKKWYKYNYRRNGVKRAFSSNCDMCIALNDGDFEIISNERFIQIIHNLIIKPLNLF